MRNYFCGWYFKCQSDTKTLAVIPAHHRAKGQRSCSIQLITDDRSWNAAFSDDCFQKQRGKRKVAIDENYFGTEGIRLNLHTPEFSAIGSISFGALSPIRYDIMGPFCCFPFMECRHSVISMRHTVNGTLWINNDPYFFSDAVGYIEGDCGCSFPKRYLWTQCCFEEISLMLSVADIPFCGTRFTGIIGVIHWHGREYRLATYLGAKAVKIQNGEIVIRQGQYRLTVQPLEKRMNPLRAPASGAMNRTIHESASCRAAYRFEQGGETLFCFGSEKASFEYEYPY